MSLSEALPQFEKQEVICEKHGGYSANVIIFSDGFRKESPCPACQSAEKEEQERIRSESRKKWQEQSGSARVQGMLARADVPPRFSQKSFLDYQADGEKPRRFLAACVEYADHFPAHESAGTSLIFCGHTGTGTCRLRYGVRGCEDAVFDGLKQDDAQDLLAMWMAGATRDEMHIEAHLMGVR